MDTSTTFIFIYVHKEHDNTEPIILNLENATKSHKNLLIRGFELKSTIEVCTYLSDLHRKNIIDLKK